MGKRDGKETENLPNFVFPICLSHKLKVLPKLLLVQFRRNAMYCSKKNIYIYIYFLFNCKRLL